MFKNIDNDELIYLIDTQAEPEILVNSEDFMSSENESIRDVFKEDVDQISIFHSDISYCSILKK